MAEPDRTRPNRRIAFLAARELSEADLAKSVEALEGAGISVEVIAAGDPNTAANGSARIAPRLTADRVSPSDYSAVAMPASEHNRAGANPSVDGFVQSMQGSGKPVLYVLIPASAAPGRDCAPPPAFSLKRLSAASWHRWNDIDAPRLGAALAYYAMLSLAPLLVLAVSIAGVFFRRALVQSGLIWQVRGIMGDPGADIVRSVLENTRPATGIIAGVLGVLTLLLGASGVFLELRDSLDVVWDVKPPYGTGLLSLVGERVFAFLMVLGTGAVLSFSILLTAVLATPVRFFLRFVPKSGIAAAGWATLFSLAAMTLVFALIYKIVPDTRIRWGDVWIGAFVTSILFTAGKWLIGLYLAKASIGSPYAAAGSLVVFLTWVYYSVQIFLFGAEFTHEYALRHGSHSPAAACEREIHRHARQAGTSSASRGPDSN